MKRAIVHRAPTDLADSVALHKHALRTAHVKPATIAHPPAQVIGDQESDIFDGLSIATSALGQPRYVSADQVAGIEQGAVQLSLGREQVALLEEYLQPATSVEIEPDDHGGVIEGIEAGMREVEGDIVEPTQRHEHPFNFWTRIAHYLRRLRRR